MRIANYRCALPLIVVKCVSFSKASAAPDTGTV